MILSKITLDFVALKALNIKDPYAIHKFVYSLFPGDKRDFLYYDEPNTRNKQILVLSHRQPVIPQYGIVNSKYVPESFLQSQKYAFKALLNTERRGPDGKIQSIIGKNEVKEWFFDKTPKWGFEVNPDSLMTENQCAFIIHKGENKITISQALFTGELTVIDFDKFKESFENGIGRAKAWGFGMLQLKRIQ